MSVELMSAVWKLDLPTSRKIVLLKMADVADDDGRNSFQSIEFLAAHTGQGERTVKRHRMEFEKQGVLVVEAYGKGGRGRFKNFRIDIERAREIYGIIKAFRKGAKLAPFRKGANGDVKGANSSTKGCQSLAPDSSLFISKDSSRAEAGAAPRGAPASAPARDPAVRRWQRHARDRGLRPQPVDDAPWRRIMEEIASRIGAGPARMWLDQLVFIGIEGSVVRLGSPSHTIRKFALQTLAAGAGDAHQFEIVVGATFSPPREPDSCSEDPKTWKQSTHACQRSPATGGVLRGKSGRRWR